MILWKIQKNIILKIKYWEHRYLCRITLQNEQKDELNKSLLDFSILQNDLVQKQETCYIFYNKNEYYQKYSLLLS